MVTVFAPVVVHVTVTVLFPVPPPAVIVPPADTVHKQLLIPASVVYTFPATPTQTGVGPASVGTGNGLTVTLYVVGLVAVHPLTLVYLILTVFAPVVVHVTVPVLFPNPPPAVIVPPADTVHK